MADYHLMNQPGGGVDNPAAGIGAGPYKVVVNEPGVRHTFVKHANYFDSTIGHADEVEILVINDNTARTAALQSGQVHMINRVDPKIVELLKGVPGVQIKAVAGRGHYVFIMHCDKAPFDNNDLRMALKYGINRQEMVDKILGGWAAAATTSRSTRPTRCSTTRSSSASMTRPRRPSITPSPAMRQPDHPAHRAGRLPGGGRCGQPLRRSAKCRRHPAGSEAGAR